MIGCTIFLLGKLGQIADLSDIYIDGRLYGGGYGTREIAEREARRVIDDHISEGGI
jgi:hypothetical protein